LKEHRDKVGEAEAKEIEDALAETKKVLNENDPAAINSATDRLTTASHKLAEAMYKASSQPGAGPTPGGDGAAPGGDAGKKDKDNVVDAEFVDVDDKK
jgi:molecular chaperone DnaK